MLASLLLTVVTASPPTVGLATLPRREGAAPPSTLIRVNAALDQQLQRSGVQVRPLSTAQRRTLQQCSLSASCLAGVAKAAGVDVVVRANVTVFADNVALVLIAVSAKHAAIVGQEGFGVSPAHVEDELKDRAARFVSSAAAAAGALETPPVGAPPEPPLTAPPTVASVAPAATPPSSAPPSSAPPEPELKAEPQPELVPPPPPPEPMVHVESHSGGSRTAGWTFTAGAGALAVASGLFLGLGADAKGTYDSSLTTVGGLTASRLTADQAHSLATRSNFDLTLGLSLGVAALAFVGAALIFFLTG